MGYQGVTNGFSNTFNAPTNFFFNTIQCHQKFTTGCQCFQRLIISNGSLVLSMRYTKPIEPTDFQMLSTPEENASLKIFHDKKRQVAQKVELNSTFEALLGGYRCRPSEFQTLSCRHFGTF